MQGGKVKDIQLLINAVPFIFLKEKLTNSKFGPNTLRSSVYDLRLSSLQPNFFAAGIGKSFLTPAHCKHIPVFCLYENLTSSFAILALARD